MKPMIMERAKALARRRVGLLFVGVPLLMVAALACTTADAQFAKTLAEDIKSINGQVVIETKDGKLVTADIHTNSAGQNAASIADVSQEDRRLDRREDRREDRQADRQVGRQEDQREDRREDRRDDRGRGVSAASGQGSGEQCGVFAAKLGETTFSGDQRTIVPAAQVNGQTLTVTGEVVTFMINLDTFAISSFTVHGTPLYTSVTPGLSGALAGDLELRLNGDRIVLKRGDNVAGMSMHADDCDKGGVLEIEPEEAVTVAFHLATGTSYVQAQGSRLEFEGSLNGREHPEDGATLTTFDNQNSLWSVPAGAAVSTDLEMEAVEGELEDEGEVEGSITTIEGNKVTVMGEDGSPVTVMVTDATRIELEDDDVPGALSDLKVGDVVEVKFDPASGLAAEIEMDHDRRGHGNGEDEDEESSGRRGGEGHGSLSSGSSPGGRDAEAEDDQDEDDSGHRGRH